MKTLFALAVASVVVLVIAAGLPEARTAPATTKPRDPRARAADEARRLATIASAVLDGDECMEIVTDRAAELMFKVDRRDPWIGSDNYDVDRDKFTRTKKLLIRVSRLSELTADCNLWLRTKKRPEKIHVVIRQVNSLSSFYTWGQMIVDPPKEFLPVLKDGRTAVFAPEGRGRVSALAPVRDSLGDVVGVVEACCKIPGP